MPSLNIFSLYFYGHYFTSFILPLQTDIFFLSIYKHYETPKHDYKHQPQPPAYDNKHNYDYKCNPAYGDMMKMKMQQMWESSNSSMGKMDKAKETVSKAYDMVNNNNSWDKAGMQEMDKNGRAYCEPKMDKMDKMDKTSCDPKLGEVIVDTPKDPKLGKVVDKVLDLVKDSLKIVKSVLKQNSQIIGLLEKLVDKLSDTKAPNSTDGAGKADPTKPTTGTDKTGQTGQAGQAGQAGQTDKSSPFSQILDLLKSVIQMLKDLLAGKPGDGGDVKPPVQPKEPKEPVAPKPPQMPPGMEVGNNSKEIELAIAALELALSVLKNNAQSPIEQPPTKQAPVEQQQAPQNDIKMNMAWQMKV